MLDLELTVEPVDAGPCALTDSSCRGTFYLMCFPTGFAYVYCHKHAREFGAFGEPPPVGDPDA